MISMPASRHSSSSCIGKPAAAVVHRDDDLIDRILHYPFVQILRTLEQAFRGRRELVALGCDKTHQPEATLVRSAPKVEQAAGASSGTVNQHPALEQVLVHDPLEKQPGDQRARDADGGGESQHAAANGQVRNDEVGECGECRRHNQAGDYPEHRAGRTGSLPDRVETHGEKRHHRQKSEEQRRRQHVSGRRSALCRRRPEAQRRREVRRVDEERPFDQCQEHDRDLQVQVEETKRHRS